MTRSEAIEFAKEQQEIFGGKMGEFLKFVEDALTQTNTSNALNALDCVERQAAIDALYGITAYKNSIPLFSAVFNIEKLPSAERRARWKGEGLGDYRCSLCGEVTRHTRTRFCPNCGARMEEDT